MSSEVLRRTRSEQKGFTLVELRVGILIVGILCAVALPGFLSQRSKAQDGNAKSNARSMVTQLESCYSRDESYTKCASSREITAAGLQVGSGMGQEQLSSLGVSGYTVTGHSRSGNDFVITKSGDGSLERSCTTAGHGGCPSGGVW
jgi:type IV pilus assembly protein PilA